MSLSLLRHVVSLTSWSNHAFFFPRSLLLLLSLEMFAQDVFHAYIWLTTEGDKYIFSYENITEESHKYFPRRWRRHCHVVGPTHSVCRSGSGPPPRQPWVMSYFMPRGCCCASPSSTYPLVKGGYGWSISITVNIKTRDQSGLLKSFEKAQKWPSNGRFLPGLCDPTCLMLWTLELSALIKRTCVRVIA